MIDMTTWSYALSHIRSHWAGFLVVSKMIGNFHAVVNFNRLFLKLNRFICNQLLVLPGHRLLFIPWMLQEALFILVYFLKPLLIATFLLEIPI